jgi:peptide/nickel transport system permease protein
MTGDASVPPVPTLDPVSLQAPEAISRSRGVSANSAIGAIGLILVVGLILMAVFADQLAPYDPVERVGRPFLRPSGEHPLGTNDIGQDLLSELIHGARISLTVGVVAAFVALIIGTTIGLVAGFYPRRLGRILMRAVDVVLVLPFLPLLIIIAAYLGRSLATTIIVIGALTWAGSARVIRSQVISLTERDYVLAARSMGATDRHIVVRHVLPRVLLLAIGVFVQATSGAILLEAALSFLGLGDPTQKSWGTMLYWAQVRGAFLTPAWLWWVLPPGILIATSSLGFALLGFSLEQRINPRLRQGR